MSEPFGPNMRESPTSESLARPSRASRTCCSTYAAAALLAAGEPCKARVLHARLTVLLRTSPQSSFLEAIGKADQLPSPRTVHRAILVICTKSISTIRVYVLYLGLTPALMSSCITPFAWRKCTPRTMSSITSCMGWLGIRQRHHLPPNKCSVAQLAKAWRALPLELPAGLHGLRFLRLNAPFRACSTAACLPCRQPMPCAGRHPACHVGSQKAGWLPRQASSGCALAGTMVKVANRGLSLCCHQYCDCCHLNSRGESDVGPPTFQPLPLSS